MDLSFISRLSRRSGLAAGLGVALLAASPAHAVFQLRDDVLPPADYDLRPGSALPGAAQQAVISKLGPGIRASWNHFGTVEALSRQGGFVATGFSGSETDVARAFVLANRDLFKLSEQGVADLELVNEGVMPYNTAQAVLFRQKFMGVAPTHESMIVVGVVGGKVYFVSSSSAGDQAPPAAATISPSQAWLAAAADLNRSYTVADITSAVDKTSSNGWNMLSIKGITQQQRVRLTTLPMPAGGLRPAYETLFIDVQGGRTLAFRDFVDAGTGKVLIRENHVYNQTAPNVSTAPYQATLSATAGCGPLVPFTVASGIKTLAITAAAAVPTNDIQLNLLYGTTVVSSTDTGVGQEALTYSPVTGVPAGAYNVQICPSPAPSAAFTAPYTVVGNITQSDQAAASGGTSGVAATEPQFKWFTAYPVPTMLAGAKRADGTADPYAFVSTDSRTMGCFANRNTDTTGCKLILNNLAARAPWDINPSVTTKAGTMTTIGNAAYTAEAWASPLTPAEMYRPVYATRQYGISPAGTPLGSFGNVWNTSKCSPTGFTPGTGQDINAAIVQLFSVHNRMHDFAYFLGFTETNYNLQASNYGLTSLAVENDPELGNTQAGAVDGSISSPTFYTAPGRDNANQIALNDGVPGITNQYLFQSLGASIYSPCADGDFDMSVVGHEYTHATSGRMVGGPDDGITGAQGGAMNESWSDLSATEYLNAFSFVPVADESPTAIGPYVTGDKQIGIRTYNLVGNPLNYSNMGYDTPGPEVHADGEIWNAVQWDIRTALGAKYESQFPMGDKAHQKDCADGKFAPEYCPGNRRWIQLIYDAYLLQPGATDMLLARNAMLASDVARFGSANQKELWHVFARHGMGQNAYTTGTADTTPIGEFSSPQETNGTVTFVVKDNDTGAAIPAKIMVGDYSVRTRPVADTDPATPSTAQAALPAAAQMNLDATADIVPDTYNFVVLAPGYGLKAFKGYTITPGAQTLTFNMSKNLASPLNVNAKGVGSQVLKVSATGAANITPAALATLIDEDENTGSRFGDAAPVDGSYVIIRLGDGTPQTINKLVISNTAGPNNPGRFTAIRKFDLYTCTGSAGVVNDTTCANPANYPAVDTATVKNSIYASADDAFPASPLRPQQTDLNFRTFNFAPVKTGYVKLVAHTNACTGNDLYNHDFDSDPLVDATCKSYTPPAYAGVNALGMTVTVPVAAFTLMRTTEIQLFNEVANLPPVAVAKATPSTAVQGATVTLDGSGSSDPDGIIAAYKWTQTSGPAVTLSDATAQKPTFTAPAVSATTPLAFSLTVTDNKGATNTNADTSAVTVNVTPVPNQLPLAVATGPATATQGATVTLDGTKSTDPDGSVASYAWTQTGGTPAVALTGANTATPSFTAPTVSSATPLTFKLVVTDNKGAANANTDTNTVTVTITPQPDQAPLANAGTGQTVTSGATNVTLDGSKSTDPDGSITAFSWQQTAGPAVTLSDAHAVKPTFTAPMVSSATPLTFKLTVTDNQGVTSSNTDTNAVQVTVTPTPDQAPVANAGAAQAVNSSANVTLDGTGSTDADGTIVTYSWKQTGGSPTVTLLGASTAKPTFTAPTVTTATPLTFQLTVVDNQGAPNTNTTGNTVTVTVSPVNSTPTPVPTPTTTPTTLVPVANGGREVEAGRGGTGSGALPAGLLLGLVVPALRRRRRPRGD